MRAMSEPLNKRVDALIVAERNKGRSFGECATIVNECFGAEGVALTRSAAGARYNRAIGKPNSHKSEGRRVANKLKLPQPRPQIDAPIPVVISDQAVKGDLFVLKQGMQYRRIVELREDTCRWPLDAPDGRTFYCGKACDATKPYCSHHMHVARRGIS